MSPSSWPFTGVPGLYVCEKGPVAVTIVSPRRFEDASDPHAFLCGMADSNGLQEETTVIMKEGSAIWAPFGHVVISVGLNPSRQTKSFLQEGVKKAGKKAKQPQSDVSHSALSFLPCVMKGSCLEQCAAAVTLVTGALAFNCARLPASLRANKDWQNWVKGLEEHAKTLDADKNNGVDDAAVVTGTKKVAGEDAAAGKEKEAAEDAEGKKV